MNTQHRDHAALLCKLQAGGRYERRNKPDMADTIEAMAEGLEAFKAEQRAKLEKMETRLSRPGAQHGAQPLDIRADIHGRQAVLPPTPAEVRAFGQLLRTGDRQFAAEARAAVNVGTSGQGLEAVAPWFDDVVQRMARDASPLMNIVRMRTVSNFPAKHIVGNGGVMGSGWVGEQDSRGGTDSPLPLVVEVPAGEWYALPSVTEWAITDLAFDVVAWLYQELSAEYAETLTAAIVAGNGTNKPTGFLAGPTPVTTSDAAGRAFGTLQYYPTGQAATMPTTTSGMIDLLLDVVHGTRWTHRQRASWVMNALTMSTLRKFKDADNRPILLDSMITGQPTRLLGYPVVECESMPVIGAGAFPIAFGDFDAGFVLDRDVNGMRITRDELTSKGFVKFYSRTRVSGKVLDSEGIKLVKVSET